MNRASIFLLLWVAILSGGVANAATYYSGPEAAGDGTGDSEPNAKAVGDGSWIGAGDVIHWVNQSTTPGVISFLKWPSGATYYASEVEFYRFVWTLSAEVQVGQFITKDPWVIGSETLTLTAIYPEYMVGDGVATTDTQKGVWTPADGRYVHGSQRWEPFKYVWDSTAPSAYGEWDDPNYNIAHYIADSGPYALDEAMVILSAESAQYTTDKWKLQKIAPLTVLLSAPAYDSFRPGYGEAAPAVQWAVGDVNLAPISSYSTSVTNVWTLAQASATESWKTSLERMAALPWIVVTGASADEAIRPFDNEPVYGQYVASTVGLLALYLQLDESTLEQKKPLIYEMIQMGIDFYSCYERGIQWYPDGGHGQGYKWPILFAGLCLDEAAMQAPLTGFQEDDSTFFVAERDILDVPYQYCQTETGPDEDYYGNAYPDKSGEYIEYTDAALGYPDWGNNHRRRDHPADEYWLAYRDGCDWNASYRANTTRAWHGYQLAAMLSGYGTAKCGRTLWDHEPFFDYTDRYAAYYASSSTFNTIYHDSATFDPMTFTSGQNQWVWAVWRDVRDDITGEYPIWENCQIKPAGAGGTDPYDIVRPGAPSGLQCIAHPTWLSITWSAPAAATDGDTASGYRTWFETGTVAECDRTAACRTESQEPALLQITGLAKSTAYTVTVLALDDFDYESVTAISGTYSTTAGVDRPWRARAQRDGAFGRERFRQ